MLAASLNAPRATVHGRRCASRAIRTATMGRARTRARVRRTAAKLEDTPKFVRDSRDDAKAAQPLDAGRTPADVDAFIADLSGDAKGDSAMTQTLNQEFGVTDGTTAFARWCATDEGRCRR